MSVAAREVRSHGTLQAAIIARLGTLGQILDEHEILVVGSFSIFYFAITSYLAARKLFWYDELFTLYMCQLPSLKSIWAALTAGVDLNPPVFYVLTRISQHILGTGELGTRLPAVLGYWMMSIGLFLFLRSRVDRSFAFLGMLLPLLTPAYAYAIEARPYGIVLGCGGIALACWQRATEHSRRGLALTGLGSALAIACSSHCFAVALWIPFLLGETIRTIRLRRVDWPIWLVLGLAACPVIIYPHLLAGSDQYIQHASRFEPTAASLSKTYWYFLDILAKKLLYAFILMALLLRMNSKVAQTSSPRRFLPVHETGALCGFAFIPFAALLLAKFSHVYYPRYSLAAIIGLTALLVILLSLPRNLAASFGPALLILFGLSAASQLAKDVLKTKSQPASVAELTSNFLMKTASETRLPIVITDPLLFLQIDHYGDPKLVSQLYYLSDSEAALKYFGSDLFDRGYLLIVKWFPIRGHVEAYNEFVARNRNFVSYGPPPGGWYDWLPRTLKAHHSDMQLLDWSEEYFLFRISVND